MLCKAIRQEGCRLEDSGWDRLPWSGVPAELLQNHMGSQPEHFPRVEFKLIYDSRALSVMFLVKDRYVRAIATADQDDVWKDSCVEFFFSPGPDVSKGYFNLEMNCGGTMLLHFQLQPRINRIVVPESECCKIIRRHSLPRIVDPEIGDPVVWTVAYAIPIALLERYCEVVKPAAQAIWRVNFYKCADGSSHPHWLTWAPVDLPEPNFHHPRSFGRLHFV